MEKLFEALGRKQLQLEAQDEAYTRILSLLAGIVSVGRSSMEGGVKPPHSRVNHEPAARRVAVSHRAVDRLRHLRPIPRAAIASRSE